MAEFYKITATIIKPGNHPIRWVHYSDKKLTLAECERMFSDRNVRGKPRGDKAKIKNFCCEKCYELKSTQER